MIDLRGSDVTVTGPFFTKDVTKTIRANVEDAVDALSKEGVRLVRANLRAGIRNPTGFTEAGVEGGALKRHQLLTGAEVGSLYGRVRMAPGLSRGGSASHPAARVPYIVERVLESGHYRGHPRRALAQFTKAARVLRRLARDIRADLTRGLD